MEERSINEPSGKETSKEESEVHDEKEDLIIHEIQIRLRRNVITKVKIVRC